jgi:hypothetical protein
MVKRLPLGHFRQRQGQGRVYVQDYPFNGTSWTQVGEDNVGPNDGGRASQRFWYREYVGRIKYFQMGNSLIRN